MYGEHSEIDGLERAALKEAGHVVIARAFGIEAKAWLQPYESSDVEKDYFSGHTVIMSSDIPPEVGLAGFVAESVIADAIHNLSELSKAFVDSLERPDGLFSQTDARLMWSELDLEGELDLAKLCGVVIAQHLETTRDLILEQSSAIREEAQHLIDDYRNLVSHRV